MHQGKNKEAAFILVSIQKLLYNSGKLKMQFLLISGIKKTFYQKDPK